MASLNEKGTKPMSLTPTSDRSSWIASVAYKNGFLALFLDNGGAMIFSGVPSYLAGLLVAGQAKAKEGGRSIGATYHKLVKGRYTTNYITDENKVRELRRIYARH
jgi:hypothetical protein